MTKTEELEQLSSVLKLRDPNNKFYEWIRNELPHLLDGESDSYEDWFSQYVDYTEEHEEDMLSSMHDWIPYVLAQKMHEYGFNMNKYGYFTF